MMTKILRILCYLLGLLVAMLLTINIISFSIAFGEENPHARYLLPDEAVEITGCGFCTVTADVLNIRSLPSMGGEVIGELERGEHVYKLYQLMDWVLIQRSGYQYPSGWVNQKYLH